MTEEPRAVGRGGTSGVTAPLRRRLPFPDEDDPRPPAGEPAERGERVPEDAARLRVRHVGVGERLGKTEDEGEPGVEPGERLGQPAGEERFHLVAGERPGDADAGQGLPGVSPLSRAALEISYGSNRFAPSTATTASARRSGTASARSASPHAPSPKIPAIFPGGGERQREEARSMSSEGTGSPYNFR